MKCRNEECGEELSIDFSSLDCENNGSSGTHTISCTYTGIVTCNACNTENEVTIDTDEDNDTGDILSADYR
ncbi:TPA: hypothetical protein ACVU30_003881 [Vibrio parahaemolyticus]|uniref:hypothetical protein n=1 Tax=Vibrio harveyi group TaxID=717610 RepID=UPI0009424DA5|nr:hypothetical protein [Vibrio parahaemolyticus]QLK45796.1 hypothetical protein DR996_11430 [Vibrio owensii]EJE4150086.1 hypothetical protein [Vibrio parahaemolyticus]MBE4173522.1 hypothetical protein [Vibrio parahaemolyticus]MBY7719215.1 hypothetical protein [Vibrio parahaemolyticus]MCR9758556.1 hypothetical protein [Vibrio parahaemolyticus]